VVADHRSPGIRDVHAVVLVGRRERAAVMDAIALDHYALWRRTGVVGRDGDADARMLVRDFVVAQHHLVGVDPGADVAGAPGTVELHALDRRARSARYHLDRPLESHGMVP